MENRHDAQTQKGNVAGLIILLLCIPLVLFVAKWGADKLIPDGVHSASVSPPPPPTPTPTPTPTPPPPPPPPKAACRSGVESVASGKVLDVVMGNDRTLQSFALRDTKKLSERDRKTFLSVIDEYSYLVSMMRDPVKPITHPVLAERFNAAAQMILSVEDPPCAWRWKDVQELVRRHGGHLIAGDYGRVNPFGDDKTGDGYWPSLSVTFHLQTNEELQDLTVFGLAYLMLQSATRIVLERELMNASGFHNAEMHYARMICPDFFAAIIFLDKSLCEWNALRFIDAKYGMNAPRGVGRKELRRLHAFDRGESLDYARPFYGDAYELSRGSKELDAVKYFGKGLKCSYPPITRGPNANMEFYPLSIDDPLINLFKRELLKAGKGVPAQDADAGTSTL